MTDTTETTEASAPAAPAAAPAAAAPAAAPAAAAAPAPEAPAAAAAPAPEAPAPIPPPPASMALGDDVASGDLPIGLRALIQATINPLLYVGARDLDPLNSKQMAVFNKAQQLMASVAGHFAIAVPLASPALYLSLTLPWASGLYGPPPACPRPA